MLSRASIRIKPRRVIDVVLLKCQTRQGKIYHPLQVHADKVTQEREIPLMNLKWLSRSEKISNNHLKGVLPLMLTQGLYKIVKPKLITCLAKAVSK